jgi:hypothetical protein
MQCNLTKGCNGNLQIKPEQDDSIKFSWECDECKETLIVQRTKEELIRLYERRLTLLRAGIDMPSIYANEALELLQGLKDGGVPDEDLKYLPVAQEIVDHSPALKGKES